MVLTLFELSFIKYAVSNGVAGEHQRDSPIVLNNDAVWERNNAYRLNVHL